MHIEILVEDSSGQTLLDILVPKILGALGSPHTWRFHKYKGIGRIPANLNKTKDPRKRILLEQLPRVLRGYSKTPGIDAVLVVVDNDDRNCVDFLKELKAVASSCGRPDTLFRLAIEEMEAWYFGDYAALKAAYPRAKQREIDKYTQDSACGTWELLADAVHEGGAAALKKAGWPLPGQVKHEWARQIAPYMKIKNNVSPSFNKFCNGLSRIANITNSPEDNVNSCGR
ncbi:MAG: DUF4276 family protein [Bdellovibrionales bacterium]